MTFRLSQLAWSDTSLLRGSISLHLSTYRSGRLLVSCTHARGAYIVAGAAFPKVGPCVDRCAPGDKVSLLVIVVDVG